MRKKKLERLKEILEGFGSIAVAFSGGVDSTFLVSFACRVLGPQNVTAVTAVAENFAPDEIEYAKKTGEELGIDHIFVRPVLPELFWKNPPDRCYHCKKAVFSQIIRELELKKPDRTILCDGMNKDDESDYRPGTIAARELGVRSPLNEAGLFKSEIRETLKEMGISIWDKPAFACLASRIPYDTAITPEKLDSVYRIERFLMARGYTQVRARLHDDIVRIELPARDIAKLASDRTLCGELYRLTSDLGFAYTALDLNGYRTGSLNETLVNK